MLWTDETKVERTGKRLVKRKPKLTNPANKALEYFADRSFETDILRSVLRSYISKCLCDDSGAPSVK